MTGTEAEFEAFVAECEVTSSRHLRGDPEPFLALWSTESDTAILGALGSYATGPRVGDHLRGAAQTLDWDRVDMTRVTTMIGAELGVTVNREHMEKDDDQGRESRTLRATQVYRRESGTWRLILRHANVVTPTDDREERRLISAGHYLRSDERLNS